MVDLAEQRLGALARLAHLALGLDLLAAHAVLLDGVVDGLLQEFDEDAADVLDDVVRGAGLEGSDGDAPLVASRRIDHRRVIDHRPDLIEDFEPFLAGHEMVERNGVEPLRLEQRKPLFAAVRQHHLVAMTAQVPLHEAAQGGIIVDVEEPRSRRAGHVYSGTCMMDRNRPS